MIAEKEQNIYKRNRLRRLRKFLCHFWLIVCVFTIVGLISGSEQIPQGFFTLLGNLFLYRLTYNGAWWFVLTYILLVLLSPILYHMVQRSHPILLIGASGCIYFLAFVFSFVFPLRISNGLFAWVINQLLLLGRSQFAFVIGMIFYRYDIIGHVRAIGEKYCNKKMILIILLPLCCFFIHCCIQSLIIAPITGIVTLVCFHLWDKPKWLKKFFLFFGRHSTNIWLTHMFFYLTLFSGFVYRLREPILVYAGILVICVFVSYGIDIIEKVIYKCLIMTKINSKRDEKICLR